MPARKFGFYLSAINEPIVDRVKKEFGFTKDSNAINYIIQEYQKLSQKPKEVKEKKIVDEEQQPKKTNYDGWFVAEEK